MAAYASTPPGQTGWEPTSTAVRGKRSAVLSSPRNAAMYNWQREILRSVSENSRSCKEVRDHHGTSSLSVSCHHAVKRAAFWSDVLVWCKKKLEAGRCETRKFVHQASRVKRPSPMNVASGEIMQLKLVAREDLSHGAAEGTKLRRALGAGS